MEVWEGFEGPPGSPEGVVMGQGPSRRPGVDGSPFRKSGRGREALLEVRGGWNAHLEVREGSGGVSGSTVVPPRSLGRV